MCDCLYLIPFQWWPCLLWTMLPGVIWVDVWQLWWFHNRPCPWGTHRLLLTAYRFLALLWLYYSTSSSFPNKAGDLHFHPSCAYCCCCGLMFGEGDDMCIGGQQWCRVAVHWTVLIYPWVAIGVTIVPLLPPPLSSPPPQEKKSGM